nr:MAG TPA: Protein of unknown function (DUF551) [Caudoviricetes sp.]
MSEWVKCSEQMPEELDDVLVTDGDNIEMKWWDGDDWDSWAERNSNIRGDDVTHWMPLPKLPPEV